MKLFPLYWTVIFTNMHCGYQNSANPTFRFLVLHPLSQFCGATIFFKDDAVILYKKEECMTACLMHLEQYLKEEHDLDCKVTGGVTEQSHF